jgi:hypothetical protein
LNASSPEPKWSVIPRKIEAITGSVRNANRPSATRIAVRSAGISSGQWECLVAHRPTGAEVDDDRVGMPLDEIAHAIVEHLRAQRRLAQDARLQTKACEVVVNLADHFVGHRVAEDRSSPSAVQRPGVLGQKCGLFDWFQFGGGNPHDRERTPVFGLND